MGSTTGETSSLPHDMKIEKTKNVKM
jgi:hypothetical protein